MGLYMLQSFILVVAEKVVMMMMMLIDDCDIDYLSDGFSCDLPKKALPSKVPLFWSVCVEMPVSAAARSTRNDGDLWRRKYLPASRC